LIAEDLLVVQRLLPSPEPSLAGPGGRSSHPVRAGRQAGSRTPGLTGLVTGGDRAGDPRRHPRPEHGFQGPGERRRAPGV